MKNSKLMTLRSLHGNIHETVSKVKSYRKWEQIIQKGIDDKYSLGSHPDEEDYPVDFVVLWLDGNDPAWQAEKEQYMPKDELTDKNNSSARFRDWDFFLYWFRAVEAYAPWVRNIYVVTWGHFPAFLNQNHPKIKCVRHDQFMPKEYLPTFSCIPTELNIWRIEGISEHIVYFNDDMFLTRPVEKDDFFCGGLPKYCGTAYPRFPHSKMAAWEHDMFNVAGVANDLFDLRSCVDSHPEKWFSSDYGKWEREWNHRAYEAGKITGMLFSHLGVPYRCSTMKKLWEIIPERLDSTCRNRFRTMDDVMHQLFQIYEIYNGTFQPVSSEYYGNFFNVSSENVLNIRECLLSENYRMICLNDWEGITEEDFPKIKKIMQDLLSIKYPHKSEYEL